MIDTIFKLPFWLLLVDGVLVALGVLTLFVIVWGLWDDHRGSPGFNPPGGHMPVAHNGFSIEEEMRRLRTQLESDYERGMRGTLVPGEPTIAGRLRMVEEHLGIKTIVKPAKSPQLAIKITKEKK